MTESPISNRLHWQCRRGMRELDLLLQGFLECGYADLDESARAAFATLLDYPDALLFDYLLGKSHPSDRAIADVINRIRSAAVS